MGVKRNIVAIFISFNSVFIPATRKLDYKFDTLNRKKERKKSLNNHLSIGRNTYTAGPIANQ